MKDMKKLLAAMFVALLMVGVVGSREVVFSNEKSIIIEHNRSNMGEASALAQDYFKAKGLDALHVETTEINPAGNIRQSTFYGK
jgi:hypothetical protein